MEEKEKLKTCFSDCVEHNMKSLYQFALRLTRNSADAEDLVAEAVARAWGAIGTLEDRQRIRPWLFRILHNCFVSDYRKKSVRPDELSYDEHAAADSDGEIATLMIDQPIEFMNWWGNPEKTFINELLGETIMSAIDSLPEVFKTTVLLINVEGLSYDEAAMVLGIPPGTIRSRMRRGRTLLQKALWEQARDSGLASDRTIAR